MVWGDFRRLCGGKSEDGGAKSVCADHHQPWRTVQSHLSSARGI
jgi:hypothetical protein